jgi:sugar lactone lactonase YvrE
MKSLMYLFMVILMEHTMVNAQSAALIEVAAFGQNQCIGTKIAPIGNRLFVSFPKHQPFLYALTEIKNGQRVPYPDAGYQTSFKNAQDLWTDDRNQLWVLDSSPAGTAAPGGGDNPGQGQFKLIAFNLKSNKAAHIYTFEDLPKEKSALNDVRIDNLHHMAYLSDPGLCAIVVLDLQTGKSRIVLQNDKSTKADPNFRLHLDGREVTDDKGKPFSSNVNGIALTTDNRYFYFRAINQTKLYRIRTEFLANSAIAGTELSAKVETVAETGVCHGMTADAKGNIFLSDSPNHAITYVSPDGKLHQLVKDSRIIWPDSMGVSPDGYLYFSCSQMNRLPKFNHGEDKTEYPYRVYKVKLP